MSKTNAHIQFITVAEHRKQRYNQKKIDQQVAEFEQKLLSIISDPTTKYLLRPDQLLRPLVKAIGEIRDGLVVG